MTGRYSADIIFYEDVIEKKHYNCGRKPLDPEIKKQKRKERNKKYYEKNKEKIQTTNLQRYYLNKMKKWEEFYVNLDDEKKQNTSENKHTELKNQKIYEKV
jgi:hypothetical protein